MYQALYRKWRPQIFDDVIGQKHITDSLKNQVASGHLSHAYLFIGSRGTGKTTCARILAKAVNCERPVNGNPCGECASCRGIADGTIMDIVELDAASNNGVGDVRQLRDEAVFSPADVKKRVYIIDEVHMLSTSAFNALLKIIEEPPEHLMFILATTELQKVPATILSRCQRHSFRRIDKSVLSAYVEQIADAEGIPVTRDAAELIAGLSEGGVRDALSMLDQCSAYGSVGSEQVYTAVGLAGTLRIIELLSCILSHDTASALSLFDTLWRDGKDPGSLLRELSGLIRDVLIYKIAPDSASGLTYGGYDAGTLRHFSSVVSEEELCAALDTLQNSLKGISSHLSPKMTAELTIVSLCHGMAENSIASLKARIVRLEKAVSEGSALPKPATRSECFSAQAAPNASSMPASEESPAGESVFSPSLSVLSSEHETRSSSEVLPTELQKTARSVPVTSHSSSPSVSCNTSELWSRILSYAMPVLPKGASVLISDPEKVTPVMEDDIFFLEVIPDNELLFRQASKEDVISKLEAAASAVCGKGYHFRVRKKTIVSSSVKVRGDLSELKKFPETVFN